jgi:hypothetical protein
VTSLVLYDNLCKSNIYNPADACNPARPPMTPDEARAAWAQLRADLSARPAGATSMAEQLDIDRRARDQALTGRGSDEGGDVHP